MQRRLSHEQVETFYHDLFVEEQARHFVNMVPPTGGVVVDVGGGCGFFARHLRQLTRRTVRVIDMDAASVQTCTQFGVEATCGDALAPSMRGDEEIACFNLMLHHLVAGSEAQTRALQVQALAAWKGQARALFVNEYIYESYLSDSSGRLIFEVTKSKFLSAVCRVVAHVVPALRANTFGVGVRFRAHNEWIGLFRQAGFRVEGSCLGKEERVALPLRLLLIRSIRRDSFLLRPMVNA
jgi:hypothetical protein